MNGLQTYPSKHSHGDSPDMLIPNRDIKVMPLRYLGIVELDIPVRGGCAACEYGCKGKCFERGKGRHGDWMAGRKKATNELEWKQ